MKLILDSDKIPPLYAKQEIADPMCLVKLFTPDSSWTWYIIEIDENQEECFGYVVGHESELGYFNMSELESVKGALGLSIERDIHFTPTLLSKVKEGN